MPNFNRSTGFSTIIVQRKTFKVQHTPYKVLSTKYEVQHNTCMVQKVKQKMHLSKFNNTCRYRKKQMYFKTPNEYSEMNYFLNYSHSVVPGGLFVISYITLETPSTLSISETIF